MHRRCRTTAGSALNSLAKFRTYRALGMGNLARVGAYRAMLRAGLHPVQKISGSVAAPPFYRGDTLPVPGPRVDERWRDCLVWFDWLEQPNPDGACPDWFANPLGQPLHAQSDQPWWTIDDFTAGDIKGVWELSRMAWVIAFAGEAARGEPWAAQRLNLWLADWAARNPPYLGPNWKCGQEAAIRVLHLAAAAVMLGEDHNPLDGLLELIVNHLRRIAPTLSYAIGQQNNHATSEAAAMYVGGSWLAAFGYPDGKKWADDGRRLIEASVARLVMPDGSFSQYSVNYHRIMLDALSFSELWRRRRGDRPFSKLTAAKIGKATLWLHRLTDPRTGDAPNIGASDGARIIPISPTGYRDFRPTVALAATLFLNATAYSDPLSTAPHAWLDIEAAPAQLPQPGCETCHDGGWHMLRQGDALAVLRYPRFTFRPSQSDLLHADIFVGGRNLLRDVGTLGYNRKDGSDGSLAAQSLHNSVTFDGLDPMPKLSRFLYGDWLAAIDVAPVQSTHDRASAAAGYRDRKGRSHWRSLTLHSDKMICTDRLGGPFTQAVLRWNLPAGAWHLSDMVLQGDATTGEFRVSGAEGRATLAAAIEARNYGLVGEVTTLEISVDAPCTIVSEFRFEP